MKWFKPKYSVCQECKVHFEPEGGRWGHLCPTHRKDVMERDLRKYAVIAWATGNWEKLEPMYLKEMKDDKAAHQAAIQSGLAEMGRQQQAALNGGLGGCLSGLGKWT